MEDNEDDDQGNDIRKRKKRKLQEVSSRGQASIIVGGSEWETRRSLRNRLALFFSTRSVRDRLPFRPGPQRILKERNEPILAILWRTMNATEDMTQAKDRVADRADVACFHSGLV